MKTVKFVGLTGMSVAVVMVFSFYLFAQTNDTNLTQNATVPAAAPEAPAVPVVSNVPAIVTPDVPASAQALPPEQASAALQAEGVNATVESAENVIVPEPVSVTAALSASQNVTLDFKDADIQNVLKIISFKSGMNIVTSPDVLGTITIRLVDVPWETALDVILKTYGFGYQKQGNIILVTKIENMSKLQADEPLQTDIFNLKFLDAQDAEKIIIPLLSTRGKISVLYTRGQKGWQFGTFKIGKTSTTSAAPMRAEEKDEGRTETISIERNANGDLTSRKADFVPSVKSKTLIITDTASSLDRIRNSILPQIDKKPKQVLIETKIIEVNINKLKDIGFDWGTGKTGASGYATDPESIGVGKKNNMSLGGRNLASEFTPSLFGPLEGVSTFPGTYPYKAGLEMIFKKLTGTQFQMILHAIQEDAATNTLSSPRILTLDNQEASILVGYHTPILSSSVTAGTDTTGPTQTQTLDYYQEIGIRLNVVPQISDEGYINMIIHPSVTSSSSQVTARNVAGSGANNITTEVNYPVIDVREAQTQILMRDGETIVLGGLLKDVTSKQNTGIPFLSKLPWIGKAFTRETVDTAKVDLLIFITAHVLEDNALTPEQQAKLERNLGLEEPVKKAYDRKDAAIEKKKARVKAKATSK